MLKEKRKSEKKTFEDRYHHRDDYVFQSKKHQIYKKNSKYQRFDSVTVKCN